jgi:hypothetical protein
MKLQTSAFGTVKTDNTENTASIVETPLLEFPQNRYTTSSSARWLLPNNGPVLLAACLHESIYLAMDFSGSIS